jgi:hypothetical protein
VTSGGHRGSFGGGCSSRVACTKDAIEELDGACVWGRERSAELYSKADEAGKRGERQDAEERGITYRAAPQEESGSAVTTLGAVAVPFDTGMDTQRRGCWLSSSVSRRRYSTMSRLRAN